MQFPDPGKLQIVLSPDPILKRVCDPVGEFSDSLKAVAERMLVLMKAANGVGLAAPQVGIPIRLFVCNYGGQPEDDQVFVNPVLSELSGAIEEQEGCLSIPGVSVTMRRAARAVLEAQDLDGAPVRRSGEQGIVRVWQHEVDHLNGRLITDNMSPTDEIANRRVLKQLEIDYAAAASGKKSSRCASSS